MENKRDGSPSPVKGLAEYFVVKARIDPLMPQANDSTRVACAGVTFESGVRTEVFVIESNANLLCPDEPEFYSPEVGSWPHSALLCRIEKEEAL